MGSLRSIIQFKGLFPSWLVVVCFGFALSTNWPWMRWMCYFQTVNFYRRLFLFPAKVIDGFEFLFIGIDFQTTKNFPSNVEAQSLLLEEESFNQCFITFLWSRDARSFRIFRVKLKIVLAGNLENINFFVKNLVTHRRN